MSVIVNQDRHRSCPGASGRAGGSIEIADVYARYRHADGVSARATGIVGNPEAYREGAGSFV
jgi:hypothetical protein